MDEGKVDKVGGRGEGRVEKVGGWVNELRVGWKNVDGR